MASDFHIVADATKAISNYSIAWAKSACIDVHRWLENGTTDAQDA